MAGIDSMSLELDALSFRVMVESDLNVEGMLIEPGKKGGKRITPINCIKSKLIADKVTTCQMAKFDPFLGRDQILQRSVSEL